MTASPFSAKAGVVHSHGGDVLSSSRISLRPGSDPAHFVETLVGAGVRVRAFSPVRRSLEDLYMEIHNGAPSPN